MCTITIFPLTSDQKSLLMKVQRLLYLNQNAKHYIFRQFLSPAFQQKVMFCKTVETIRVITITYGVLWYVFMQIVNQRERRNLIVQLNMQNRSNNYCFNNKIILVTCHTERTSNTMREIKNI